MRRPIDRNETASEKFKRLATLRTNAVIDRLRILGNLSNKQLYDYTEEDINRIFSAINKQLKETRIKFTTKKKGEFVL